MVEEYDIREDEEQSVKLQEIIDLLVTAGYFRARIKGLSAFDKVVGGMIWSMDSCNFDLNVDLLYQENSTIGQKIALTEKIVTVLPKIECPHRIEPHQIQGLDFIHIFPVIQWLIKRSVKVRGEKREFIRQHALLNYKNQYTSNELDVSQVTVNIKKAQEKYRRKRLFKKKCDVAECETSLVDKTLLEYGFPFSPLGEEVHSRGQGLFSEALEIPDSGSLKIMGNVVNSQAQKIAKVSNEFAKLEMDFESSGTSIMMKQKDMMLKKKKALEIEEKELVENVKIETEKINKIKEKFKEFEEAEVEKSDNYLRIYKKLQTLVLLEEKFKKQELLFREHCKSKLEKLQLMLKESCKRNQEQENSLADSQVQEEKEVVQSLKLKIAKKNRAIALLQRQLDEIPGRGELAQYQRRFLELYNEVAQKHEETKQFYTMYNTLDDTKLYLSKELSLLNSVLDNYSEAMSNSIDKEEFMTQFETIVSAIQQNKKKVEKRKLEERHRRDKLSNQLLDLVEQQRNYVNIVKQLKIECKRNEELLACFRKQC